MNVKERVRVQWNVQDLTSGRGEGVMMLFKSCFSKVGERRTREKNKTCGTGTKGGL